MEKTERTPLFAPTTQAQYFPGPPPIRAPTGEYAEEGPTYSPSSPSSPRQQFNLDERFKKKALMLDTDVHFFQSNKYRPDPTLENYYQIQTMLPFRKLRLQIDPSYSVRELVQLVLSRVSVHPFIYYGMIAKSQTGYELSHDDPVGEVAERGDSLRAFFFSLLCVCFLLEHA